MLALVGLFFLLKKFKNNKHAVKLVTKLRQKLFYNGFSRYMITSNLKLTIAAMTFLFLKPASGDAFEDFTSIVINSCIVAVLIIYPGFMGFWLLINHKNLKEPAF